MKKIVLMCLFGLMFADTVYYQDTPNSKILKIEEVIIEKKDEYNIYYKKINQEKSSFIAIDKVNRIEDENGDIITQISFNSISSNAHIRPNSGTHLKKTADYFGFSRISQFCSLAFLSGGTNTLELAVFFSLLSMGFDAVAISELKAAGVLLEIEQQENKPNNE
ncbi:MAG: hypothetical protein CMG00_07150 [Candidatus Marinimicrobia bacterium]|nr:hypothetical protein [Candidatus Neomarinimicrobiota bacterium]